VRVCDHSAHVSSVTFPTQFQHPFIFAVRYQFAAMLRSYPIF